MGNAYRDDWRPSRVLQSRRPQYRGLGERRSTLMVFYESTSRRWMLTCPAHAFPPGVALLEHGVNAAQ
jgi:hypothetical protein